MKPAFKHKRQECVEHEIKTTLSEIKTRSQSLLDYWVLPSLEQPLEQSQFWERVRERTAMEAKTCFVEFIIHPVTL